MLVLLLLVLIFDFSINFCQSAMPILNPIKNSFAVKILNYLAIIFLELRENTKCFSSRASGDKLDYDPLSTAAPSILHYLQCYNER